ncbi:putative pentatricopeptide repeat-containing protein [Raphanus sativus]|nr:putative pentatricopeptide repeat-containing protein [Raphanus sativus]
MEGRGLKPTNLTHNMVIQGLVVADKTEDADAYYKGLEHDRGYDATFIKAYCKTGRLDEAFERFDRLGDLPLPKNVYFILVSSLCASDAHHIYKAQLVLNRTYKLGVEPGKSMHGIMIGAWCRVRNVVNARRNFKVLLKSREITPDKYTYTTMINTYCLMERFDEACVFFKDMKKRRVVPDLVTFTIFEDHNPIHDIMREMKARNFEPDRHMVENGVEPDGVAYAALINCCCKNGCEDKAQKLIHEMMVGKGMTPLESCMVTYALLKQKMVENGMMTPFKACEDLYALIQEMIEKGMRLSKACMDLYVTLKQKMVENWMIAPAKACEDLYLLMQEMMKRE